ncbi:lysylphosphatidylglycerol synthase transmembrane domain-containing protein [Saccharomonospora sp. NPDC046836]|uniref:lysylphosphatidylglycerol synthase transmembrane domain-containing protein n=1 Tax=Saccharomonospora sp. NPDC046836 TaxID=3156921 RepID=UPI0034026EA8
MSTLALDTPRRPVRARVLDAVRWAALAAVLAFALRQLVVNWPEFWHTITAIAWQSSVLSLAALIASIAVTSYGWQVMVDQLGPPVGYRRAAQICLVGQLGKYVPGSLWAYLLQMELGRRAGLARARVFTGSLVQFGVGLVAALVLSLLALPMLGQDAVWLLVLVPAGLAALHPRILTWGASLVLRVLRRPPLGQALGWPTIGRVFGAALGAWTLQGLHLWLLVNSVGAPGVDGLVLCIGAMAIAMTAGTVAFLLPSGAGVRELVLVAVLTAGGVSTGQALAFALASRVMFTVADLVTAGGAAALSRARPAPE